ncbi:unnamed protein product [Discosporangium mesarthrocarpum]
MSWFGKGKEETPKPSQESFMGDTAPSSDFGPSAGMDSGPNLGGGARGGASGAALQEALASAQQNALVQQIVSKLTETAFMKCVERPSSSLSSKEQSCINATVLKYLDSSEFVLGRMMKSQQGSAGL